MLPGKGWTREREILVLELYFRKGRRRLSPNHPEVIALADVIGIEASTINARMGNFVACDPDSPRKGWSKPAKQTKSLWAEFAHDEPRLRKAASEIRRKYGLGEG